MACSTRKTVRSLTAWAKIDPSRRLLIGQWLDEAILNLADGSGSQITTASTNGTSYTMAQSITLDSWIDILSRTIEHLDNNTRTTSITIGIPT